MTVHSAKGLEFKNVFIAGLEEKLFPSIFSGVYTPESIEEERRLFYVALTRAMKNAWISYAKQRYSWGQLNFCEPSRFISEIDEKYLITPSGMNMPSFFDTSFNQLSSERKFSQKNSYDTPQKRSYSDTSKPVFGNRLSQLKQAMARPSFESDDPELVKIGSVVEHQRFGRGKVLDIEGSDSSKKATVLFDNAGRKQLLLKFARLKVVG